MAAIRDLHQVGDALHDGEGCHDQRKFRREVSAGTTLAGELAAFYTALDVTVLPPETVHAVRRHVLDTLGAALAGAGQPEPSAVLDAGGLLYGSGGEAALWGRPGRAAPALAALVNGAAAHALELDDASGCDPFRRRGGAGGARPRWRPSLPPATAT